MIEFTQNEINLFLDDLKESGKTNMFGAGQFITDEFECTDLEAQKYLMAWMHTFSQRHKND